MNYLVQKHLFANLIIILVLFSAQLPAVSEVIWSGRGKIFLGLGEGGEVELKLKVKDNVIVFLSGPARLEKTHLIQSSSQEELNGIVETSKGRWEFVQYGNQIGVTFYQKFPQRLVRYRLMPL